MKELKINIPEGYCIDEENSTFECIKFKPKELTYNDIAKELFKDCSYYINGGADVHRRNDIISINFANNATSERQCKKLLAINKLMNVAKYLNDGWKPDWSDVTTKWTIRLKDENIDIAFNQLYNHAPAYFKTKELAEKAIKILGEDTIKLALSTDW